MAVEVPSAAGKTTWCGQHASEFVEEYTPTGVKPGGSDPAAEAAYWVEANTRRWAAARELEAHAGTAVCDSDPLKLHYSWCLSRVGAAPWARFERELVEVRRAFVAGELGFADVVLVSIPPVARLHANREADDSRRRESFAQHIQLLEPLRTWYQAVDALKAGRVVWELPGDGLPARLPEPRARRCNPTRLDQLVALLPSPERARSGRNVCQVK